MRSCSESNDYFVNVLPCCNVLRDSVMCGRQNHDRNLRLIMRFIWMDRHRALPRERQTFRIGLARKQEDLPPFRSNMSYFFPEYELICICIPAVALVVRWYPIRGPHLEGRQRDGGNCLAD